MTTWLVTGANRGLGLGLARRLRARGDEVIGTVRPGADAAGLRACGADVLELDVRSDRSAAALAQSLAGRPIDVLVNNAGRQCRESALERLDLEEVKDTFDVNAFGPLRVTRALLKNLRAGRKRHVVFVSSRVGSFGEFDGANMHAYRASKAALNMFLRCLAGELGPEGFVLLALHPGWVRTDMGGPSATLGVEESVDGMVRVIDGLTPSNNGEFRDHCNRILPW